MATITNYFLSKPPPSLSNFPKTTLSNFTSFSVSPLSFTKSKILRISQPGSFSVKATATSGTTKKASNERVQKVHSIEEFDEALRNSKNRLVVVEFAESDSLNSRKIYPFMVDLSRTCNDVDFLLVMGDESEKTRELCQREKIDKQLEEIGRIGHQVRLAIC